MVGLSTRFLAGIRSGRRASQKGHSIIPFSGGSIACLVAITVCGNNTTSAASFDCAKAATVVEKTICSDQELSTDDEILAALYKAGLAKTHNKRQLIDDQRSWIRTRSECPNHSESPEQLRACLRDLYFSRGDILNKYGVHPNIRPF